MTDAQHDEMMKKLDNIKALLERLVELNTKPEPADMATRYAGMSLMQRAILQDARPVVQAIGKPIDPPKGAE